MHMVTLVLLLAIGFPVHAAPPAVLVLGDSLSAAYGISADAGWVAQLAARLDREGYPHRVVNASASGETTRGALARLPALLERHDPQIVVLALGGNDGLRGIAIDVMRENLERLVRGAQARGARVVIVPVRLPPNYGRAYIERFAAAYRDVAARTGATLAKTLLAGVAEVPQLMQADGLHPRAEAQARMLDNVWPALESVLAAPAPRAAGRASGLWHNP